MARRGVFVVEVEGLRDLDRALARLPQAVSKSVLREALRKASAPTVATAQAHAPRRTGALAASIAVRTQLTKRQRRAFGRVRDGVEMFIGPTYPKGAHGHLVEFGTRHMPARPFLRPAWDITKQGVLDALVRELWSALDRAARRLAGRAARGVA